MATLTPYSPRRFRHLWRSLRLPGWLKNGDAEGILYTAGLILDAAAARARQGLMSRFPTLAHPSALPYHGQTRKIIRGLNEPDASYANRLVEWRYPKGHRTIGNPFALMRQIRAHFAHVAAVKVRTVDVRGNWYTIDFDGTETHVWDQGDWDWDGAPESPRWGRFWVIVYTPPGLYNYQANKWGGPGLVWGGEGLVWGAAAGPSVIDSLKKICRQWRPAGTKPEWLIWTDDDSLFEPGVTNETDGTWEYWTNRHTGARYAYIGYR